MPTVHNIRGTGLKPSPFNLATALLLALFFSLPLQAEKKFEVGLTADMPYVDIQYKDTKIRIKRIQNTNNRITSNFSKTSRVCPPFCISPMQAAPNVKTVGELEVIEFIKQDVSSDKGLLIDARLSEFYEAETIPGAINIPFTLFNTPSIKELIAMLGVKEDNDKYDFSNAKTLYLFCNGPWCEQSPRAIKALIKFGYPPEKLYYYRGGMQLWKLFSLTTVLPKPNQIDKQVK
ncbi:MAG TPA: rhodanese-like domain-containing protein [Leucothrix mucor]|nr:rhodanese-like domain-containing protein [Leucothrix mucor]